MLFNSENSFFAYLSQYSPKPHWKFLFPNQEGRPDVAQMPVGVIVHFVLNHINRLKGDGHIDFSRYADTIESRVEMEEITYNKEMWDDCYQKLVHILCNVSDMSNKEKETVYKTYGNLAYFYFHNYDWDEWLSYVESGQETEVLKNLKYGLSDVISFRGNRIDINGTPYACYKVAGFEYLFILDLWELLFNPATDTHVKRCKYCNDFFYSMQKQRRYCEDCHEPKQYNKIKNAKQKQDEAKRLCKRITDILYRRDERGDQLQAFSNENQYYKDILRGKSVKPNPNYLDIKTQADYIQWLKKYHASIKKRGLKREKTNETS